MKTKIGKKVLAILLAVFAAMFAIGAGSMAYAATGDTPPHSKRITDNQDGTYTISLDITGESEKKPNNVNVIVIFDTSGSMNTQRMNAAKNAVNSLANALYAYNTQSEPNTVQMALVQFATSSSIAQNPTNSQTTFTGAVNRLGNAQGAGSGGTNWESALQTANGVSFGDDDQTFVVFVSDGNPTFRTTQNGWNDWSQQYQQWGTGQETTQNIQRCYTTAVDDAQALATKVTPANFFTIGAFGNVDRMEQLTDDAGSDSSTNYYSAQNTAALNQAIADILAKIEMAGFADAEIDDGTTSTVTQSSGEVSHLLVVDESSYKYYRTGGDHGTMEPWTDAPEAELVNGTVEWDLSEVGVLENGVRYTVTFDCYPSQETYDIIAQLKNGDITYASLDSEIKKYIVDNGGGSYSLRTNTNASIAWDDTRDDAGRQTSGYTNPDPVATDSETLTASKEWEGGSADVDELEITVLMDDEKFHTTTISKPDWSTSSFISIGIIKNGNALPGAEGHDFKFAELGSEQYHWELESPVVRPMLIDGGGEDHTPTMLIMVDDAHPAPSGAETYTIEGKEYYADTSVAGLTAVNHRRSNLNLTKVVTGEDAPADAMFPFELTVNNSKAPETAPSASDDPKHESDYWVWLSVRDENNQGVTGLDMGDDVVEDSGGYYYAPSGTTFSLEIGADWSLRFLNLPTDTTYTFEEGTLPEGFAFNKSELTQGEDSTFSGAQTTTGTIENTKTSYYVTYTNDYALTDLEVTKVWADEDNQDGYRLTAEQLAEKLTLSPAVEGKTPTVVDNEDGTYTITYTGLPRFNNGAEVEYEVTEDTIDNYTTEGSPAKDHGTITNTHTPETTNLTVTKAWEDEDNEYETRPESIQVQLLADEKASGEPVTLNDDNEWTYTWENLDVYAEGEKIVYSVDEVEVENYATTVGELTETDTGYEITITNSNVTVDTSADFFSKIVETGNPTSAAEFEFTVTAEDGTPMPTSTKETVSYDAAETGEKPVDFGTITYTEAGTYTYTITETTPDSCWTVSDNPATVTVEVSKADDGTLSAKVTDASITNNYTSSGSVELQAVKAIEGADWPEGKTLTFTLSGEGGTLPETTTATLSAPGTATFGAITYTQDDVAGSPYTYTITEDGFGDGWSATPESGAITATVTLTDDGEGNITATATYSPEDATITNTYEATGSAEIEVTKNLTGRDWLEGETFTFTLSDADGEIESKEVSEDNPTATFTPINYTQEDMGKTFTYTVSETGTLPGGISKSGDVTVTVTVTDNGDGTLSADVSYQDDNDTITNTYEAEGEVELEAIKELEGREWQEGETYTFTLKDADGNVIDEQTVSSNSTVTFDTIEYTEADMVDDEGNYAPEVTFTYTIEETSELPGGVTSSGSITATVTVTDNGDGTLSTAVEYTNDDTITNTYEAKGSIELKAGKLLKVEAPADNPPDVSGMYTIAIAGGDDAPMPETTEFNNADGEGTTTTFGKIAYNETHAGKTFTYTITEEGEVPGVENGKASYTVKVKVTDNGDGTLKAEVVEGEAETVFTNTYSVEPVTLEEGFEVYKDLTGTPLTAGAFEFELAAAGDAPMPGKTSATNDADGKVVFDTITYEAPGTYTYTIKEKDGGVGGYGYDGHSVSVTVVVTDNGEGELVAEVSYDGGTTFVNTYEASGDVVLTAAKKLDGRALEDKQFTFELLDEDGKVIQTKQNNASGAVQFDPIEYDQTIFDDKAAEEKKPETEATKAAEEDASKRAAAEESAEKAVTEESGAKEAASSEAVKDEATSEKAAADENATGENGAAGEKAAEGEAAGDEAAAGEAATESAATAEEAAADEPKKEDAEAGEGEATAEPFRLVEFADADEGETATMFADEPGDVAGGTEAPTANDDNSGEEAKTGNDDSNVEVKASNDVADEAAEKAAPATEAKEAVKAEKATKDAKAGKREKTFTYTIREVNDGKPGYAYDGHQVTVTVTVVDDGEGNLVATPSYDGDTTFTNTYEAEGEAVIEVTKAIEGYDWPEGKTLTFTLSGKGGTLPEAKTAELTAPGTATFGAIAYDESDAGKTYTYKVTEDGLGSGWTGSGDVTATVKVTDNGDGTLSTEVAYSPEDATITNTYKAAPVKVDPPVKKVIKGNGDLYNKGDFTFTIEGSSSDVDKVPMPAKTSITNVAENELPGKKGWYEFGEITFTEPGTYKYTVTESGSVAHVTNDPQPAKEFTFTVTDDGSGKLKVDPETDDACWTFTNVYSKNNPGIEIEKEVVSTPKDGKKYQEGETVKYEITVTNTGDVDLTDVVVTDDLTGDEWTLDKLAVDESKTFKTSYKVTKSDAEAGEVVNQATVTAKDPDGKKVTDKDKKKVPTGKTDKPSKPKRTIPKTGDSTPIVPIVVTVLIAAAAVVIAGRKMGAQRRR